MRKVQVPTVQLIVRGRRVERRLSSQITITEAAAVLGVTRRSIYNYIRRRQLQPFRRGGRWYLKRQQVVEMEGGD